MVAEDVAVVLLPGLDGTGLLFQPLVEAAPPGVVPVVVEYPASSDSTIEALSSLVRDRQPDGRWLLVAESFSGPLAIKLSARNPPGLSGLVLVATAARWTYLRWFTWLPLTPLFRFRVPDLALRFLLVGRSAPQSLLSLTRAAIERVHPAVLASRLRELARVDATPDLRRVRVPVLYLEAQQDRLVRDRDRASVLNSPIEVEHQLAPGPHFLLQVQPAMCWQLILDFHHSQGAG
jgi:pimeloyl-ACP methyl ester carboxylesterase